MGQDCCPAQSLIGSPGTLGEPLHKLEIRAQGGTKTILTGFVTKKKKRVGNDSHVSNLHTGYMYKDSATLLSESCIQKIEGRFGIKFERKSRNS